MRLFAIIALLLGFNLLNAQDATVLRDSFPQKSKIDEFITKKLKQSNVQGMSALLVDSSGKVWSKGYGFKDVSGNIPVDEKTVFCVGSISKTFTGIALMQLHERGELDINKPVKTYIPEFRPLGSDDVIDEITIKSVMTHHAGLPSDSWKHIFDDKPVSSDDVINFFNTNHLCTKPNTILSYSNMGYALLGCIIEKVSGQSFNEYIKQNITEPLEMKNSSFVLEGNMKPLYSKQYLRKGKEFNENPIAIRPAGSFLTNAEDMTHYLQMLINKGTWNGKTILKEETFNEMIIVQNRDVALDYDTNIGLTFFITDDGTWFKAGGSFSHSGSTRVFHANMTVIPYQKIASFVVANTETAPAALNVINRQILDKALEIKGIDTVFPKQVISEKHQRVYVAPNKYKEFAGMYAFPQRPLYVKAKKNKLKIKSGPLSAILKPAPDSSFFIKIRLLGINFSNPNIEKVWFDVVDGDTVAVLHSWDRDFYLCTKAKPVSTELIKEWESKQGVYHSENKEGVLDQIEVVVKKGRLYMNGKIFGNQFALSMLPKSNNQTFVDGLGRSTGDVITLKNENGKDVLYGWGMRLVKK